MPAVEIHEYQDAWVGEFRHLGAALRQTLCDTAVRIDHIGSTSIPGLGAKPIIDVQVSVASLDPVGAYRGGIESLGFVWRQDNVEKTKRYFREQLGKRRTHIHVRKAGSWHEQYALLFRDYVRQHARARKRYEHVKRELAARFPDDMPGYTDAKGPIFWEIIQQADRWAAEVGWEPGLSDA
jgi:GrpB-like predicted nucleotidyltransferase (UPF0157 family)